MTYYAIPGQAIVGSSIIILTTNLLMMFLSMTELALNAFNAYNCYFLAYGGLVKENVEVKETIMV